jgi:hypothetical protein
VKAELGREGWGEKEKREVGYPTVDDLRTFGDTHGWRGYSLQVQLWVAGLVE